MQCKPTGHFFQHNMHYFYGHYYAAQVMWTAGGKYWEEWYPAIREELPDTPIVAYSAKYASAFYGPFREAAESAPAFGDRRGYQMDPANVREALRECEQDVAEGADVLMIKPALPYLDVIRAARERFDLPLAAYNVSGEYAMVKAAAAKGFLDERQAALETLTAIKRAGADLVVSYWTKELASWL